MWAWIKKHFCFHKWEHVETHAIQRVKPNLLILCQVIVVLSAAR